MSLGLRLVVALVTAGALGGGGTALDRRLEPRAPSEPPTGEGLSGALFCPHGGGEGWQAWVTVANPGPRAAEVRLTGRAGSIIQEARELLAPGTHRTIEVPATSMTASAVVEFLGGPVAAGTVMVRPETEGGGVAAEPCATEAATRWWVPEASTRRGEASSVILHNPFAAEAVVDVGLIAGSRSLQPGRLKGIVLRPGQVRAVDLGRFALGEDVLTATVSVTLGRVVAGGVTTSAGGIRATTGVSRPARRWILPGGGDGSGVLAVTATTDAPAPIHARSQSADTEAALIDLETVPPRTVVGFDEGFREAGVVVEADGAAPFLAARRLVAAAPQPPPDPAGGRQGQRRERRRGGGRQERREEPPAPSPSDLAATVGVSEPAEQWVVLPPVPPGGGTAVVLIQNPGSRTAEVEVTALGAGGPGEAQTAVVLPRTTARVDLPQPAAARVRALRGSVVAAGAALGQGTYAVAVGVHLG
jgi:P pilus assembly chaperone PapD